MLLDHPDIVSEPLCDLVNTHAGRGEQTWRTLRRVTGNLECRVSKWGRPIYPRLHRGRRFYSATKKRLTQLAARAFGLII
jgi:hypothetical protein